MTALVVGRDGHVDEFGGGVGVAEGNDGDVDVGGFLDCLGVSAGIGDDDETGFFERASDVVGEIPGSETSSDGGCAGVGGKLEYSALAIGTSGDDGDVSGIVDCCDDAGCEDDFLPATRRWLAATR